MLDATLYEKYADDAEEYHIRGLSRFPVELLMKHAVKTWVAAVLYIQGQADQKRMSAVGQH